MSSYIIAGSADSLDTAYCQQIARRIKAKYKNIDFRMVIKHPSEWEQYLQQICRIYGFLNKSNPIVYTFDGKIIGNKESFMANASKYFGLEQQSLIVQNLSNKVNMKQAQQEINNKKIVKNNIKTMNEKIQSTYQTLLKKKILKHQLQTKQEFLHNGIQYQFREVSGLCKDMAFIKDKKVDLVVEQIKPQEIDLMALSVHDQIKPDEPIKEAFVTNNQNSNIDEKMSEASKTNKLHESMMSYDNNSKGMKESSSKQKSRIDEQFDDLADFIDRDMTAVGVCNLGDNFNLAFEKNAHIQGEMVVYHNQDPTANIMRVYNLGRPVKGHKPLIFDIPSQTLTEEPINVVTQGNIESKQTIQSIENQSQEKQEKFRSIENERETPSGDTPLGDTPSGDTVEVKKQEQKKKEEKVKAKTHPNFEQKRQEQDDKLQILSQRGSQLNLVSNLNYHTLMIAHPLSLHQIKTTLNLLKQTDCIATLQFLPDNPNPKISIYHRFFLTGDRKGLLPIEKFVDKQIEEGEYDKVCLYQQGNSSVEALKINQMGFNHLYYEHHSEHLIEQVYAKTIKHAINNILELEETLRKEIGYNMIITKKYTMFVPLTAPYRNYNNTDLYLDGLAFLGYVNIAKVTEPFKNKERSSENDKKTLIREYLAKSTNFLSSE